MSEGVEALRAAALAATPGPWWVPEEAAKDTVETSTGDEWINSYSIDQTDAEAVAEANAAFIALANPAAILALLDRIAELEVAVKPFAEASAHLHPSHPLDATTLDGIEVRHWLRAGQALPHIEQAPPAQGEPG